MIVEFPEFQPAYEMKARVSFLLKILMIISDWEQSFDVSTQILMNNQDNINANLY